MSNEIAFEDEGQELDNAPPPPPPPSAPIEARAPAKPKPEKRFPQPPQREAERGLDAEESQNMADWIRSFGGQGAVKVNITRLFPMKGKNDELIGGSLETVEDYIDEDYIRTRWGGGTFMLKVLNPAKGGGYLRGRQVKLAGPPKMHGRTVPGFGDDGLETMGGVSAAPLREDASTVTKAMEFMAKQTERSELRAERLAESGGHRGLDHETLREIQAPLLAELAEQRRTIAGMQTQLVAAANKPPERDEFRDKLMGHMLDRESSQVETLRVTYEARIAKLRDDADADLRRANHAHEEQIKRIEDRHEKEIKRLEDRHDRDLKQAERISGIETKSSDTVAAARVEALQAEKERMGRELTAAATKIAALEARKDQTITEKADELIKVQEALQGLGGGGTEGDEKWWEKAIAAVGNTEAVGKLINKFTGGPDGGQQPQQPMNEPPIGVPFRGPDGQIYIRPPHAPHTVMLVNQHQLGAQRGLAQAREKKRKQRTQGDPNVPTPNPIETAEPGVAADPSSPAPDVMAEGVADDAPIESHIPAGRAPTPDEMEMAVNFINNAIRSGNTTAEQFARTAQALIPHDVIAYLGSVGVDRFFSQAKLEPGSPLTSIKGRQFVRQVHRFLMTGSVDEAK